MTIVESVEEGLEENEQQTQASAPRARGTRRRRLTQDEERDIARLYAETNTPTSEIRERFGIGDSSLYRVVQRHGVALRGRTTPSTPEAGSMSIGAPAVRRRRGRAARASTARASTARRTLARQTPARRGPRSAVSQPAASAATRNGAGARQRFEIHYKAERVFQATDVSDALRQAESLGATEITEVAREDR